MRLRLYHYMKENPETGRKFVEHTIFNLVKLMPPANALTLNTLINGADGMAHVMHYFTTRYLDDMEGVILLQFLPTWAGLGFPTIEMDLEFIQRLLRVNLTDEQLDELPPPFDVFEIVLPPGLFSSKATDGTSYKLNAVKSGYLLGTFGDPGPPPKPEDGFAMLADTDAFSLWSARTKISEMGHRRDQAEEELAKKLDEIPTDEQDHQTIRSLVQIIGHVSRLAAAKGGLEIPGDDILLPNFRDGIMPDFTKRIFKLGPADLPA